MPTPTTTPNMNPTDQPGSRILSELEELKNQLGIQQQLINKQQLLLTNQPASRQPPQQQPAEKDLQFNSMQDFMKYVVEAVSEASKGVVDARMDEHLEQFAPLLKEATQDSSVWSKQTMIEEIIAANPGTSYQIASELAETRIVKDQAIAEERQTEANTAARLEAATQASVGQPGTSSGNMVNPIESPKNMPGIMEKNWESLDLNTKLTEFNKVEYK